MRAARYVMTASPLALVQTMAIDKLCATELSEV